MPSHWIRPLFVSTLVLGSFGTLADAAQAAEPSMIPFKCTVPMTGTVRCGDPDRNIRIGPEKRLSIEWTTTSNKAPHTCMYFYIYHAVSGEQLGKPLKLCGAPTAGRAWTNPDSKAVDVYVKVGSDKWDAITINGWYYIDRP